MWDYLNLFFRHNFSAFCDYFHYIIAVQIAGHDLIDTHNKQYEGDVCGGGGSRLVEAATATALGNL